VGCSAVARPSAAGRRIDSRDEETVRNGQVVPVVERFTVLVRGQRVILAGDRAEIYGIETRTLNQAVKRNAERFPPDFVFRLTRAEAMDVHRSRSQSVILKRGANVKHTPLALRMFLEETLTAFASNDCGLDHLARCAGRGSGLLFGVNF
jgi:ORF6N domain